MAALRADHLTSIKLPFASAHAGFRITPYERPSVQLGYTGEPWARFLSKASQTSDPRPVLHRDTASPRGVTAPFVPLAFGRCAACLLAEPSSRQSALGIQSPSRLQRRAHCTVAHHACDQRAQAVTSDAVTPDTVPRRQSYQHRQILTSHNTVFVLRRPWERPVLRGASPVRCAGARQAAVASHKEWRNALHGTSPSANSSTDRALTRTA